MSKERKCDNCKYLYSTSYEYGEYECAAGVSEDDEHFTGDGCTYHWNKLRAMKERNDKAFEEAHTITDEDLKIFFPESADLSGMSIIHIIFDSFCIQIHGEESESKLTVGDCYHISVENGYKQGTITVIAEYPLEGDVYRYGNHGEYWEHIGKIKGYA